MVTRGIITAKTGCEKMKLTSVQRVAVDGMLCALGVVGRVALSALPSVQPVTAIIILTALYIGVWDSVAEAVVIVAVTNMILGVGMWSLYQTTAWVLIGILSAVIFARGRHPLAVLAWGVVCAFGYGAFVSIFSWKAINTGANSSYIAYWLAGLPMDGYHAVGNAVFVWFMQPVFERILHSGKGSDSAEKHGEEG